MSEGEAGCFWLTVSGDTGLFFVCVASKGFISPLFMQVRQGKELQKRFLDVWQGKELGDFGGRGERRRPGERTESVRRELIENNIDYYDTSVKRDCGTIRTG
jgi:hypothetical protein